MNKNILIEGFLPATEFYKKLYDFFLLNKDKVVNEFDVMMFNNLKSLYEKDLDKKASKAMLNQILKQINKNTKINLKKYVKYYDSIIEYLENKSEVSFYDCINSARIFDDFIYQGMSKKAKKNVDEGNIDFEKLMSLVFSYQNLYTNSSKIDKNLIYSNNGLNLYYPKNFISFLAVIKDSGYSVSWCTQSRDTWYQYSSSQAVMIIEIEKSVPATSVFNVEENFRLISLKVDYDNCLIDEEGSCDINNEHMGGELNYLSCIDEIKSVIYDNEDQLERPEIEDIEEYIQLIDEFLSKGNKKIAEDAISKLIIVNSINIATCEEIFSSLVKIKDKEEHEVSLEDCIGESIANICYFNTGTNSKLIFDILKSLDYNTSYIFKSIIEKAKSGDLKSIYQICSNYETKFFDGDSQKNIFDFVSYEEYNFFIEKLLDRKISPLTLALMKKNEKIIHLISDEVLKRIFTESEYLQNMSSDDLLKLGNTIFKKFFNEINRRGLIESIDDKKLKLISFLYGENKVDLDQEDAIFKDTLLKTLNIENADVYTITSIDKSISTNSINEIMKALIAKKDIVNYVKFASAYFFRDIKALKDSINISNLLNLFGPLRIVENNEKIKNILSEISYAANLKNSIKERKGQVNSLISFLSYDKNIDFYKSITFDEVISILSLQYEENIDPKSREYGKFIYIALKHKEKFVEHLSNNTLLFSTIVNYFGTLSGRVYNVCQIIHLVVNKMHEEEKIDEINYFVNSLNPDTRNSLKGYYLSLFGEDKEILFPSIFKKSIRKIKKFF